MGFCGYLKQSTSVDILLGPFIDDTDGKSAETGLTIDVELSKNGQALADSESAAPTHDAAGTVDGYYNCVLGTTDTGTLGILSVVAHAAGFLPVHQTYQVVTANWFDTMCSTDQLDVNVTNVAGTAQTGNDNGADINAILTDTGTTLDTLIKDIPTVAEFEARTLVAADYVVVGDTIAAVTTVNGLAANVITAASINGDAITEAKIADNAIAAEHIANAAIDNATFAADVGSTAHGTNIIALAVRKILEELNLDHLLKVDTGVAADGDLENYCVAGTVMGHLLSTSADATLYKASTDSMQAIRDHIGDGSNLTEAGDDGDHLTAINLPNQTMDITGDITGNLSGSVGSVTALGNNCITAASINADAITEAKIADNAVAAEHIAAAAIDNATFAADVGSTAYATNIIALAVRKALDELNLDHLMKVAVSDRDTMPEVVDDTVLANIMTKTDGDTSDFDHATDSLESIRDEQVAIATEVGQIITALVNKLIITKANGNAEQFNDSDVSLGTIAGAFTSDATTVTRLRMVQ